jgi:glucarate dehydratase
MSTAIPKRTSDLRIARLVAHPIAIADPPLRSSYGLHAPYALRTILEVVSDDGVTGISETHGGESMRHALEAIAPRVTGVSAWTVAATLLPTLDDERAPVGDRSQTYRVPGENPLDAATRVYSALEMACLDLVGRAVGQPLCNLLGGPIRREVPFAAYLFYKHAGGGGEGADARQDIYGEALTAAAIAAQARQMIGEYGFQSVKLKAGVLDPPEEIATIQALRAELGSDVPLRLDPNCAWSVGRSIEIGAALVDELAGGGYLEDPTSGLDGMAAVRRGLSERGISTPLASNVAVTSFDHLPPAIRQDAVQIVLCDPHYWGGLRAVQYLARLCETFGLGLSMHSNSHLGVSLMAMAHVAAATPHLSYACDTHYPWQHEEDEVVEGGRIPISGGSVQITDRPGLGIELDRDALARGRERYERCSYRQRNDEAEMRKHVDPTWTRRVPQWS